MLTLAFHGCFCHTLACTCSAVLTPLGCPSRSGGTLEQGADWCPGWPHMENTTKSGNGATSTTAITTSGDDPTPAATTSSAAVDAAVELDGCCFVLSVSDTHNTDVAERSAPFCIAGSSAEAAPGDEAFAGDTGGGGGGGGGASAVGSTGGSDATLEVIKFPLGRWELGTVQEVCVLPACMRCCSERGSGGICFAGINHARFCPSAAALEWAP